MGTRGRAATPRRRGDRLREANILALSDVHLGHELKRGAVGRRASSDGPLVALLDHYRQGREGGLPWRLILAGDVVDFIGISETPGPDEVVPFTVSAAEREDGLAAEPEKAVWKLGRVLALHRPVFEALARFLVAGHEVVVVRGNHDLEWGWTRVQQVLVDALTQLAFGDPPLEDAGAREAREAAREAFVRRLTFVPWIYVEPGRIYVEHGHAYDHFSTSDDALTAPEDGPGALREPVSTLVLRYFGNHHASLDPSDAERWGFVDFVRWGLRGGRFVRVFGEYLVMSGRVLAYSARASARTMVRTLATLARTARGLALEAEKVARIRRALGAVRADHEELAEELAALLSPPAEQSVLQTAQMLYIDRLALAFAVVTCAAGCAVAGGPPGVRAAAFAAILLSAWLANLLLGRTRYVDSHPKLQRAARRVSVLFRVPIVVMGHSHRAVSERIGEHARYFNLGTWLGASHDATTGVGFPHLVVRGSRGELRRWKAGRGVRSAEVA